MAQVTKAIHYTMFIYVCMLTFISCFFLNMCMLDLCIYTPLAPLCVPTYNISVGYGKSPYIITLFVAKALLIYNKL